MNVYLVGGAIRDKLLGLTPREYDWVVVGATPEQMIDNGYKAVGKEFPVFLHPETREEYALARTERKTGPGYKGFDTRFSPDITLEEDLLRRDLTINAIAEDREGNLIDPYGGASDIQSRTLRHVSSAFSEDPVRILRVARFAARFHYLGFRVDESTNQLMRNMVDSGEIDALVPERIWKEFERALSTKHPHRFIEVLNDCNALEKLFPEIHALFGVPQPELHHPEIDTGIHTLMVVETCASMSEDPVIRFSALLHDLGKGVTPREEWPSHHNHEENSVPLIKALCKRLRVPNEYRDLAILVARYHLHCHRARELKGSSILKLLKNLDAFRKPERLEQFLLACEADARGRKGFENEPYPQAAIIRNAFNAAREVDAKKLVEKGLQGQTLAKQLYDLRLTAVKQSLKDG